MNTNYITSDIIVAELINDYNIQSTDFIPRAASWIVNAINELGIYEGNTQLRTTGTFGLVYNPDTFNQGVIEFERENIGGFELPYNHKTILELRLNDCIAHRRPKVTTYDEGVIHYKPMRINNAPVDKTLSPQDLFISLYNKNVMISTNAVYEYSVNGNFVYTSIPNGTYELIYKGIPSIKIQGIDYPYVLNNALLKRALKAYILKMLLMRGYVHPQLTINSNNPFMNPALDFEQLRHRVKTSCGKMDVDERNNLNKPLNNF